MRSMKHLYVLALVKAGKQLISYGKSNNSTRVFESFFVR